MARMHKVTEKRENGGWSDWQAPAMHDKKPYRMGCCDCGLAHDVQFLIIKDAKYKGVYVSGKEIRSKKYRILMRARRNKRSTAGLRRKKKGVTKR